MGTFYGDDQMIEVYKQGYMWYFPSQDEEFKIIKRCRYVWESINGPIQKGMIIHHLDENKLNDDISNLVCVSRSQHMSIHTKGKTKNITDEWKKHIGEGHKGKKYVPMSEEHKKNISMSKKGKKHISNKNMFKPKSEEHKKNISKARKGKKLGPRKPKPISKELWEIFQEIIK